MSFVIAKKLKRFMLCMALFFVLDDVGAQNILVAKNKVNAGCNSTAFRATGYSGAGSFAAVQSGAGAKGGGDSAARSNPVDGGAKRVGEKPGGFTPVGRHPNSDFLQSGNYFQQQVNYKIRVRLNDERHTISGSEEITYINHSPNGLDTLWFHLWPNAYKNNNSALAKQLLDHGKTDLYFSKPEERGFIDSLDFAANDKKIKWMFDKAHEDICLLVLNESLKTGDSVKITTPFFVKIPDAKFSRLGHTEQAYFITQWYPKPAVYDNKGWHAIPYLDQGEFYSEFGTFDVSISLPRNYYLAATGDRVDAKEEETFILNRVTETLKRIADNTQNAEDLKFPASETAYKTVRFVQNNVHDFAWFADKRFYILSGQVQMPRSGRKVDTWIYFTNSRFSLWKDALDYVNRSAAFYSELVGDYPYHHITAVDGTIMAGGGMEYPNITVIGEPSGKRDLEITIAHEVGHNWFYGILASNERLHAFLDEGVNSYYEMRYSRKYYATSKLTDYVGFDSTFRFLGINKTPLWKDKEIGWTYTVRSRTEQAIELPSEKFTSTNYGTIVYGKTPLVLDYIADYTGQQKFDKAMQDYFEKYTFKHPDPDNFFETLAAGTGSDMKKFREGLVNSTGRADYKICRIRKKENDAYTVKIKNKGGLALPFSLDYTDTSGALKRQWVEGFTGSKKLNLVAAGAKKIMVDAAEKMPDADRRNNAIRTEGLFKKRRPLQFRFLTALEDKEHKQLFYLPMITANFYNGLVPGVIFHNYGFYKKRLEFFVAPGFGLRSKTPTGMAQVNLNLFPQSVFQQVTLGLKSRMFAYDNFRTDILNKVNGTNFKKLFLSYLKVSPFVDVEFKKRNATSRLFQHISITTNLLMTDSLNTSADVVKDIAARGPVKKTATSVVNMLSYELKHRRMIDPFALEVNLQQSGGMAKIYGAFSYSFTSSPKQCFSIRVFGGSFISGSTAEKAYYAFRPSGYSGSDDYLFDGNYLARNEANGLGPHQFMERDGNMKVQSLLGGSPQWMAAINLRSPKLFVLPMKLFVDVMVCDGAVLPKEKMLWDAGLQITLLKNVLEVYVPLGYSTYTQKILTLNGLDFYDTIRFTLNIGKLTPETIVKDNFFN